MCLGAIGDAIQSVDKAINSINPMKGPMEDLTDSTVSKVYKPAGHLYDLSNSHPLESLVAMGVAAAAWEGAGAALGGAGEAGAGAGAGAEAGAGAGAEAGAGAAASLPADVSVGTTGAGGATATAGEAGAGATAGAGAGGASSTWLDYGKGAAKLLGPALLNAATQPRPPKTKAPTAMPDPLAQEQAQRQKIIDQLARRGRASTILTSATNGSLGG